MTPQQTIFLNGINGVTGQYLVPPVAVSEAATWIKGKPQDRFLQRWLRQVWRVISQPHLGLPFGVEPADVRQAGWAVVFHNDEEPAVKKALEPLIEHRLRQIGDERKVKVLTYRPNETWNDWLTRNGASAGTVDPTRIPYYLLLVGSPACIPFVFGHLLDVEYAVGRLHFDRTENYSAYVTSLINYETSTTAPNAKQTVFFAPRHLFDDATRHSADLLVNPLTDGIPATAGQSAQPGVAQMQGFVLRKYWGETANKEALRTILAAPTAAPPALLFTASHGIGMPLGHPLQRAVQGALLCQDWPGFGQIHSDHYFTGGDVVADACVHGLITFHFACYSAGTPGYDRFAHQAGEAPPAIAPEPFIAMLPQALLAHPQGGALACIGHVERAWGYSLPRTAAGPQLQPFQNALARILAGQPVGHALKDFNERYAALSTGLSSRLEELEADPSELVDAELVADWTERNDAEGYVILGDPAVRIRVNDLKDCV